MAWFLPVYMPYCTILTDLMKMKYLQKNCYIWCNTAWRYYDASFAEHWYLATRLYVSPTCS